MEELKYVIEDSTIAELLGVQNFSTDEAAILELVKNAYDANALNLKIIFRNNELQFVDNGIGMNEEDIKEHWMHIGKSDKKYEIVDENNKTRIQAGSKGVGRFADRGRSDIFRNGLSKCDEHIFCGKNTSGKSTGMAAWMRSDRGRHAKRELL